MAHITLLALRDALASSLTLPLEMFTAADHLARADDRHRPALRHSVVSIGGEPVPMAGGLTLQPDANWLEVRQTSLLILPALWRNPRIHLRRYPELLPWLAERGRGPA